MSLDIIFMGSSHFSLPTLHALSLYHNIVAVCTAPVKPSRRGQQLHPNDIKRSALAHGFSIYEPKTKQELSDLALPACDVVVVAAYGLILPKNVLDFPKYGCINVHPSLLPHWRGATPIQSAILAGDNTTGVSIIQMNEGCDTGLILGTSTEPITSDDTYTTLESRLSNLGAYLVLLALPCLNKEGVLLLGVQNESLATYTSKITKESGRIDWSQPAEYIDRQVRAYNEWPRAWTMWKGKRLQINRAAFTDTWAIPTLGEVIYDHVHCGRGSLILREVTLEGSKQMPYRNFMRGHPDFVGSVLG